MCKSNQHVSCSRLLQSPLGSQLRRFLGLLYSSNFLFTLKNTLSWYSPVGKVGYSQYKDTVIPDNPENCGFENLKDFSQGQKAFEKQVGVL